MLVMLRVMVFFVLSLMWLYICGVVVRMFGGVSLFVSFCSCEVRCGVLCLKKVLKIVVC